MGGAAQPYTSPCRIPRPVCSTVRLCAQELPLDNI